MNRLDFTLAAGGACATTIEPSTARSVALPEAACAVQLSAPVTPLPHHEAATLPSASVILPVTITGASVALRSMPPAATMKPRFSSTTSARIAFAVSPFAVPMKPQGRSSHPPRV